jgi:putative flippase GtrA
MMRRVVSFVVVGGLGFAADAAALALLLAVTPFGPFLARILSIAFALTCTWLLNRSFTFGPSRRAVAVEGARYGSVGIATGIANYLVYSALLLALPGLPPLAALAVASIAAMALSFAGYSRLVFDR